MRVRVLYFGVLKDLAGVEGETVEVREGSNVGEALRLLRERTSKESGVWTTLAAAVNREYASPATRLQDGDELALLPPVSGGLEGEGARMRVEITDAEIDAEAIVSEIKAGSDGAVCVFDGIVRDNTRGRRTLHLDYEAYREMALAQMGDLAEKSKAQFGVRDVAIVHRLGRLLVGETSVLIVVASAHRGAAFDACRWIIDTLKKTVPIWKKEQFIDGAVWADGEPFPEELKGGGRTGQ